MQRALSLICCCVAQIVSLFNSLFLFSVRVWGCCSAFTLSSAQSAVFSWFAVLFPAPGVGRLLEHQVQARRFAVIAPSSNQPQEASHCFSEKFTFFFCKSSSQKYCKGHFIAAWLLEHLHPQNSKHLLYFRIENNTVSTQKCRKSSFKHSKTIYVFTSFGRVLHMSTNP
jgi:hypothetical protein